MEFFQKANVVRLRSYHDKYMLAHDDQQCVYQDRNGSYKNAKWSVEIVEKSNVIRLKSCYGKYLTASNMPFLIKGTAKKVLQTMPTRRLDSSIEWEPIREGVQVRLKTRYGQYLRGNGGLPPWRNSITHDVPHRSATANWILWDVDIVELRPQQKEKGKKFKPKPKPTPITPPDRFVYSTPPNPSPSSCGFSMPIEDLEKIELRNHKDEISYDCKSLVKEGRIVLYDVGNKNGDVNDTHKETLFTFKEVTWRT
ncbi:putative actin cross-linking [Lupinus albus]|uniref:Putative actin cross-linking n=1 Tax=Lupinus albus TaxID=3870 RepID=A0A6A4R1M2_LUPAL|nr:putative actin cross-linking [Lupinus albus]